MVIVPGRQLRAEMRRSVALVAAAAAAVLLVLLLALRQDEWTNGWTGLSLTLRNNMTVLVPLALAAGCWQGGRERRANMDELTTSTPLPDARRVLTPAAGIALDLFVALAGTVLGAAMLGGPGLWLGQTWPATVVAVGLLSVTAAVLVGVGMGRAVRTNLVAPLALLVVSVLLLAFTATYYIDSWPRLLSPALESSGQDTSQVRTAVSAGQTVWFMGLLLGGIALAAAGTWRTRALAGLPALVGFALAVPLLSAANGTAFTDDPVAARLVCASGQPPVCVAAVHQAALLTITNPARDVLARLEQLPSHPTRAIEVTGFFKAGATDPPANVLPLHVPDGPAESREVLTQNLASGLGVRPCQNSPGGPLNAFDARMAAGAWLLDSGLSQPDARAKQALHQLRQLTRLEQRQRMTDLRKAFQACDRDPLELFR